jgi:hypothetical protein
LNQRSTITARRYGVAARCQGNVVGLAVGVQPADDLPDGLGRDVEGGTIGDHLGSCLRDGFLV